MPIFRNAEIIMAGQLKKSGAQKSLDFESAVVELEQIVVDMEAGKLPLEDSLAAYKRGAELLSFCRGRLEDAQQQVSVLENGVLKDFSANGETGQAASIKPLVPSGAEGSGRD
ncbi:MAG: exodeoxyribonuclease VII small subunit [Gallionellales bacterium GWA2_55_18]|nr:MAG: exodeoxyribonuclease VII small subunit [Gallionellales bacterium GWA2_55_18]